MHATAETYITFDPHILKHDPAVDVADLVDLALAETNAVDVHKLHAASGSRMAPLSVSRCALCTSRSRIASAMVGLAYPTLAPSHHNVFWVAFITGITEFNFRYTQHVRRQSGRAIEPDCPEFSGENIVLLKLTCLLIPRMKFLPHRQ